MTKDINEFNVMSKISMAEVMRDHSYTDDKIDYIIQCAKNALKNNKNIPDRVKIDYPECSITGYGIDFILDYTIREILRFIKDYKLYDLIKDEPYIWRGDVNDCGKNSYLCNGVESPIKNSDGLGLEFKYTHDGYITISIFRGDDVLLKIEYNLVDLYDWMDAGDFRMSRLYINGDIYTAKGCYIDYSGYRAKVVYTF